MSGSKGAHSLRFTVLWSGQLGVVVLQEKTLSSWAWWPQWPPSFS